MSVPNDFFKTEDGSKAPIAKLVAVLILAAFISWLLWAIYSNKFFENNNKKITPISTEEKINILNSLNPSQNNSVSGAIPSEEKVDILNQLKSKEKIKNKETVNTQQFNDEKMRILNGLR